MSNPNIMIVDDTPINLKLLISVLEDAGYNVRPTKSGSMALKAARLQPPDLILLDIQMPDMDGYAVCEALKLDTALEAIPVFFISALGEDVDKARAKALGIVEILHKPFRVEEVLAKIAAHLP